MPFYCITGHSDTEDYFGYRGLSWLDETFLSATSLNDYELLSFLAKAEGMSDGLVPDDGNDQFSVLELTLAVWDRYMSIKYGGQKALKERLKTMQEAVPCLSTA